MSVKEINEGEKREEENLNVDKRGEMRRTFAAELLE
jgi:hypothetical protein